MTESTEVAQRSQAQVPALAPTPATEITADDVALPALKLGQFMSEHVQEERVKAGSIFTALGSDDPDPQTIWTPDADEGVLVHILDLKKGKSISEGGELVLFDFNDPDAPPDAWVTYNYVVALPEVDPDVPCKWLLTRTGRPCAQQINLVLTKNAARGPAYELAFEVTAAPRENDKGKFFVPRARHVEAKAENVEVAKTLAEMISGRSDEVRSTGEEPAI